MATSTQTRRAPRSPYSERSPFDRAAATVAGRRLQDPVTERLRALRAAEEERRAGRVLDPGDLPELEDVTPSQFLRGVLGVASEPAPATLRTPPYIEQTTQQELLAPPLTRAVQERVREQPRPYREALADCSARIVEGAITWAGGNKALAAKTLGLSRPGLYKALWRTGAQS
jgi:DNA-binding NtrC family response regulator